MSSMPAISAPPNAQSLHGVAGTTVQLTIGALSVAQASTRGSPAPLLSGLLVRAAGLGEKAKAAKVHQIELLQVADEADKVFKLLSSHLKLLGPNVSGEIRQSIEDLKQTFHGVETVANEAAGSSGSFRQAVGADRAVAVLDALRKSMASALMEFGLKQNAELQMHMPRIAQLMEERAERLSRQLCELKASFVELASERADDKDMALLRDSLRYDDCWDADSTSCLEGTRASVLFHINSWIHEQQGAGNVLWLRGMAGRGKTTIARSVAQQLEGAGLVSRFFFRHNVDGRNSPRLVFTTLARDLAQRRSDLRPFILEVLWGDPDIGRKPLDAQFAQLISDPLMKAIQSGVLIQSLPIYILWDALDEGRDALLWSQFRRILITGIPGLPPNIRFIITSRPDNDIQLLMDRVKASVYSLDTVTQETTDDLWRYIKSQLNETAQWQSLPSTWPADKDVTALVKHSAGLFIWAATVTKFIDSAINPPDELHLLLSHSTFEEPERALDELYKLILLRPQLNRFAESFQVVVGALVVLQTPVSTAALAQLIRFKPYDTTTVLKQLGAVLTSPTAEEPVECLHPSFFDFLTTPSRCSLPKFFVTTAFQHKCLAKYTLNLIHATLQSGLCCFLDQNHDYALDKHRTNQAEYLAQYFPEALQYACCYFANHVQEVCIQDEPCLLQLLKTFYYEDLLSWLKVMSLLSGRYVLQERYNVLLILLKLSRVLNDIGQSNHALEMIAQDAVKFVRKFGGLQKDHITHISAGALLFTPQDTELYRAYRSQIPAKLRIVHGSIQGGSRWGHHPGLSKDSSVSARMSAIAFSSNGQYIVSGSDTNALHVWHAETGQLVLPPLAGHSDRVICMSFSHDGRYIISGSKDKTVWVWGARTGQAVLGPLKVQSGAILSVGFSKDGQLIFSHTERDIIHLWNAQTGQRVLLLVPNGDIFHRNILHPITSLALSNDRSHAVTTSKEKTFRVWNTLTGFLCPVQDLPKGMSLDIPAEHYTVNHMGYVLSSDGSAICWLPYSYRPHTFGASVGLQPPFACSSTHIALAAKDDRRLVIVQVA